MTDLELQDQLVDRTALALTAWAEGRGDWRQGNSSVEERLAIMCCCRNRLPRYRSFMATQQTYKAIVLAHLQFSCWNPGQDRNHQALLALAGRIVRGQSSNDPLFDETLFLADGVISGIILDQTGGAVFYYAPKSMVPIGRVPKEAANKVTLPIGDQLFYT